MQNVLVQFNTYPDPPPLTPLFCLNPVSNPGLDCGLDNSPIVVNLTFSGFRVAVF